MNGNAVIYCRVSSKDQVKGFSLEVQERDCRVFCQRQGLEVAAVFVEQGESAKTADRTELNNMLAWCRKNRGRVQYLVVHAVDRLARDTYDHAVLRRQLRGLGITLRAAMQSIEDSPSGRVMEGMLAIFAQYDNEQRGQRVRESMKLALRSGRWTHKAPLGYLNVSDGGEKTLMLDPVRAPLVQKAFRLYATGLHQRNEVLQIVTAMGLQARKGEPLTPERFAGMLANPLYIARVVVPVFNIDVPGQFPRLIDDETFFRVQALLAGLSGGYAPYQRNRDEFPLRGFVVCEVCRKPLTASWSRSKTGQRHAYYHCPARGKCKAARLPKAKLEQIFLETLQKLRPRPEYLRLFEAIVLETWRESRGEVVQLRASLETKVRDLKAKRAKLEDRFIYEDSISAEVYEEHRSRLGAELADAEIRLHDARIQEIDVEGVLDFALHLVVHADRLWLEGTLEQRQQIQRVLFPAGVLLRNEEVRTPGTSSFFCYLGEVAGAGKDLVAHTGFEPVLPP